MLLLWIVVLNTSLTLWCHTFIHTFFCSLEKLTHIYTYLLILSPSSKCGSHTEIFILCNSLLLQCLNILIISYESMTRIKVMSKSRLHHHHETAFKWGAQVPGTVYVLNAATWLTMTLQHNWKSDNVFDLNIPPLYTASTSLRRVCGCQLLKGGGHPTSTSPSDSLRSTAVHLVCSPPMFPDS